MKGPGRTGMDEKRGGAVFGMRATALLMASLCAALCALAVGAGPASADRTLAGRMNGYNSAASVAVDAGDNVWITDSGQASKTNPGPNGLYKYDPFPSLNLIATPNTFEPFGHFSLALQMAVDDATGELFVAQSNGRGVYIFAPKGGAAQCKEEVGEPVCYTHAWTRINGQPPTPTPRSRSRSTTPIPTRRDGSTSHSTHPRTTSRRSIANSGRSTSRRRPATYRTTGSRERRAADSEKWATYRLTPSETCT